MESIRVVLLLCLCSAMCCGPGLAGPGAGEEACPPPMWVQYNSSCYTLVSLPQETSLSIERAHKLCKDIGADIVSISSQEENAYLLKMLQTTWKGQKEIILGMFYDSDDDSLKWFDKSEVTFSNWNQGQVTEGLNTCVKMDTLTGLWSITECDNMAVTEVLCKTLNAPGENKRTDAPGENKRTGWKTVTMVLLTAFTLVILAVPAVALILYKIKPWSSRHLQRGAQVLPCSDDAVLVDTMEREDYE